MLCFSSLLAQCYLARVGMVQPGNAWLWVAVLRECLLSMSVYGSVAVWVQLGMKGLQCGRTRWVQMLSWTFGPQHSGSVAPPPFGPRCVCHEARRAQHSASPIFATLRQARPLAAGRILPVCATCDHGIGSMIVGCLIWDMQESSVILLFTCVLMSP